MIFGEKYFSGYILSTDQISLSHCLYFLTYCAICALQLFVSQFTRLKFEINYSFLIKAFSYMTKKVRTNIYRYQEQKQLLRWNKTGHLNKTWNKTATFTTGLCLSFQIFLSRFVLSTSFFILKNFINSCILYETCWIRNWFLKSFCHEGNNGLHLPTQILFRNNFFIQLSFTKFRWTSICCLSISFHLSSFQTLK